MSDIPSPSLANVTYWHGSASEIEVGAVLEPRPGGYVDAADDDLETLFETERPEGCLSRRRAIFMVEDPDLIDAVGGYLDHVYEVRPQGPTGRHDLAWYSEAQCALEDGDVERAKSCAGRYWAGDPYHGPEHGVFEILAASAEVVGIEPDMDIDGTSPGNRPIRFG